MLCHPPSEPKFQGRYPLHTAIYDYLFVKTAAWTITQADFFISLYVTSAISLIAMVKLLSSHACRTYQKVQLRKVNRKFEIFLKNFSDEKGTVKQTFA